MAEPTPSTAPVLPSTADEVPYAPVSWLAVGAVGVAGLFVFLLLLLGFDAYRGKKPFIMPELLILAGIAIVLSFAARRVIRTAEGTRTGERLTDVAWWMSVVAAIVYMAYWFAIEFAIRRDAKVEAQKWMEMVAKGEFGPAFHRTLEPGRRTKLRPDDEAKLTAEFRDPMLAFKQIDISRLALRNPNECTFTVGGLRDWVSKPSGVECVYTGIVKCPEGSFPVHIPLKGSEGISGAEGGPVGRQWQVIPSQNGFIQLERITLTKYGWLMLDLEKQAGKFGRGFVTVAGLGPGAQPYAYQAFVKEGANPELWAVMARNSFASAGLAGGWVHTLPQTPDYLAYLDKMLVLPNGTEPPAKDKAKFREIWDSTGLVPSGQRLKSSPDVHDLLTVVRNEGKIVRVEVRIPVELPWAGRESMAAARGRLVVATTDPAALSELEQRHASANPDVTDRAPPPDFDKKAFVWRVVRLESDMYRITPQADGPGGPGGPGGMPPGM